MYTTVRDNQTSVSLRIFSGERPICRYCDFLGQLVIPNLPKKLAGEVSIEGKHVVYFLSNVRYSLYFGSIDYESIG